MSGITATVIAALSTQENITTIKVCDATIKLRDVAIWFRITPSEFRITGNWLRITASRIGITGIWHYIAEIEFFNAEIWFCNATNKISITASGFWLTQISQCITASAFCGTSWLVGGAPIWIGVMRQEVRMMQK